jgi:hypothetical protein
MRPKRRAPGERIFPRRAMVCKRARTATIPSHTAVRFGHINPGYSRIFKTFSEERVFSPVGSNIVDLTFFVPGTKIPAVTRGFGAVYTDVDQDHTAFEYFDRMASRWAASRSQSPTTGCRSSAWCSIGRSSPACASSMELRALGPDDRPGSDVSVMDDYIYGEPQASASPGRGYTYGSYGY